MRALLLVLATGCHDPAPAPAPPPAAPRPAPADAAVATIADAAAVDAPAAEPTVPPAGKLATDRAAIAAYRAMWDRTIAPYLAAAGRLGDLSAKVHAKEVTATKVSCREHHLRIVDTIGPDKTTNVVFGKLPALDRDGTCWLVDAPVSHFTNLWGYLDAATGELLVVWHTIEG